jgi:putative CocE/NonD family hydrolase
MKKIILSFLLLFIFVVTKGQTINQDSLYIVTNYYKIERSIPMRDGIKLFTSIYIPKDDSKKYPIMMMRTPYSCAPYGENNFRNFWSRNTKEYLLQNYIIVTQDVRGCYMSEGVFEDIRPYIENKKTKKDVDEASDTYDAIEWMIKNIPSNNGKVGISGISYPGFYSTMAALSGHQALKAVSPQAPVTDWFIGDDVHHNGAFFMMDDFNFDYSFGRPRPKPTTKNGPGFDYHSQDNYDFFLKVGTLKNLTTLYMGDSMKFWKEEMSHPNYDSFWKDHTVTYHLKNIKPAVLITGGLFDAEDCWGAWNTYKTIEKNSPKTINKITMGPWSHGGWARSDGSHLGNIQFGKEVSAYYYKNIEMPFFNYYLKGEGDASKISEATIFITGENKWTNFTEWPPKNIEIKPIYLGAKGSLSFTKPISKNSFSEYISDPAKPIPYTEDVHLGRTREYMSDDQRFAARRPDVLVFSTDTLTSDITLAGPVIAKIVTSISTTDADFIVKIIDVFPNEFTYSDNDKYPMGGYQMLVRGEIMRGKFRNSLIPGDSIGKNPEPFVPGKITEVNFELPDVAHTFLKGHKIMVQIQSSWFPLVDRNPQQFLDIYHCDEKDFIKSTIKIYHDADNASSILLPILKK